jgi:hypothetical protein
MFEQLHNCVLIVVAFVIQTSFALRKNLTRIQLSAIILGVWMYRVQTAEHYTGLLRNTRLAANVTPSLEPAAQKVEFIYRHWKRPLSLSALS